MTEQLHPNDEQLRKADEADVAEWKQDGEPLSPEDQKLAADRLAELREEVKKDNEGENDD